MVAKMNYFDTWAMCGTVVGLVMAIYSNLTLEDQLDSLKGWNPDESGWFKWQYGSERMYSILTRSQWFLLPFCGYTFGQFISMRMALQ
jgi:hypothetical protein